MQKVVIYTTPGCPYCADAKELLNKKGVKYEEIQVDKDATKLAEMMKLSNRRSVPQIFINNEFKKYANITANKCRNENIFLEQLLKDVNNSKYCFYFLLIVKQHAIYIITNVMNKPKTKVKKILY